MSDSEVKIDGVTIVLARNSLLVDQRIEGRSVSEFIIVDRAGSASYGRGQPVAIYDPDAILVFGGFIDSAESKSISPSGGLYHSIMCMDNHYLADKRLVVESYLNELAGDIVKDIRTKYLADEGVTIGEIQDGAIIKDAIFNYVKVSEAYDALAEMAGFTWYLASDKKLYFIDRATNSAPFTVTASDMLKNSASLIKGNPIYRNRQFVIGGTGTTSLQTEDRTGDGEMRAFAMGYPLAKVPTITEDAGPPKNVGIKGIDTGKDWYWNKGDNVIYAEIAPGIGVAVQCKYYGQYPLISRVDDSMGILDRKAIEGGTGIVEDIIHEAQHESSDASKESAAAKLANYARNAEKFVFRTRRSGLAPGQLLPVTYSPFGFSSYDMLIESVVIRAEGGVFIYDVSAITGPALGTWSQFFSSILARQDKSIRIGDSLLLVLLQEKETLSLAESTDIHADTPPTYRELARTGVAHELLPFSEATSYWAHEKGKYCYAPKTNGAGLREGRYGFATYG